MIPPTIRADRADEDLGVGKNNLRSIEDGTTITGVGYVKSNTPFYLYLFDSMEKGRTFNFYNQRALFVCADGSYNWGGSESFTFDGQGYGQIQLSWDTSGNAMKSGYPFGYQLTIANLGNRLIYSATFNYTRQNGPKATQSITRGTIDLAGRGNISMAGVAFFSGAVDISTHATLYPSLA